MARVVENGHDSDPGVSAVVQVAAGEAHTLALTASGSVYTWGRGQLGRVGMGVFQDELAPMLVEIVAMEMEEGDEDASHLEEECVDLAERSRITQIAAGAYHSLALGGDGTVWSWGFNACQLGRENAASFPAPITFPRASNFSFVNSPTNHQALSGDGRIKVVVVEGGGMMSSAIDQDGGLWLWGAVPEPSVGVQITDSDAYDLKSDVFELANIAKPERVLALRDQRVRRVACGNEHIIALVDGRAGGTECYAWGSNSYGQLGLGDFEARDMPTLVTTLNVPQHSSIVDFACGAFHSAVVTMKPGDSDENETESDYAAMARKMDRPPIMMGREQQYMESPRMRPRKHDHRGYGRNPGNSQNAMTSWVGRTLPTSRDLDSRLSTCWTFGQNENGQLGLGTCVNSHTPTAVDALPTRERIQTLVCGLFHTAVVMESGDVWVWGMEGGLGQCPGIGPPGSKSGDALTPVRVFGDSSAKCHPVTGAKGIACGAAHTVTVSDGGKDLWAWGRGKNGVLGLGHQSDSWFPSPVLWPSGSKDADADLPIYDIHHKSSSPASSRGGFRDVDDVKPPRNNSYGRLDQYVDDKPPRTFPSSLRKAAESPGRPRRGDLPIPQSPGQTRRSDSPGMPVRRGDHYWPPSQLEQAENPKSVRRETGPEPLSASMGGFKYQVGASDDHVTSLKTELVECRRYAESLHVAIYGGLEDFSGNRTWTMQGKSSALQEWERHVEDASMEELGKLDVFYKGMRNRLKDVLFQRKMEEWCVRTLQGSPASSYQEPPPVREPYSVQSTPYFDGPGELALRMSGIMRDRGEMLPPAALGASPAEFRLHSQRRR